MIEFKDVVSAVGTKVKTELNKKRGTKGMLIRQDYLDNRKDKITGTVRGYVAGHGGDVWWVEHDEDKKVAAYCTDEMTELKAENVSQNSL